MKKIELSSDERALCLILCGNDLHDAKLLKQAAFLPGVYRLIVIGEKSPLFDGYVPKHGAIEFYPPGTEVPLNQNNLIVYSNLHLVGAA